MNPINKSNDTIAFAILKREREIQGFLRDRRIINKNNAHSMVDHIGAGHYYYVYKSRKNETIMDIIFNNKITRNGGFIREVQRFRKGDKVNIETINKYVNNKKNSKNIGIDANISKSVGANIGWCDNNEAETNTSNNFSECGNTLCDIVIIQIGGTTNGCCCKKPSRVNAQIEIQLLPDDYQETIPLKFIV